MASFNPVLDGQVYAVAASADGSRIYIGGDFTTINGVTRNRIAAFDTATGALVSNWHPSVSYRVKTISVSGDTVYFGGSFGLVNGTDRLRLAAVTADLGTLLPWAPSSDGDVYAVDVADDGSKVYAGGQFSTVNGTSQNTVSSLDPTTGTVLPFPAASAVPPPNGSCTTRVKTIDTSGDTVYFGNGGDGSGCFDGTWSADVASGALLWKNECLGATEAVKVVNGWLYKGSHAHDCAYHNSTGHPQGAGYRFPLTESLTDGHAAVRRWRVVRQSDDRTGIPVLRLVARRQRQHQQLVRRWSDADRHGDRRGGGLSVRAQREPGAGSLRRTVSGRSARHSTKS